MGILFFFMGIHPCGPYLQKNDTLIPFNKSQYPSTTHWNLFGSNLMLSFRGYKTLPKEIKALFEVKPWCVMKTLKTMMGVNAGQNACQDAWKVPRILLTKLVGGFNPFEKYQSKCESSPDRRENKKHLKPPPRKDMDDFCWAQNKVIGQQVGSTLGMVPWP